MADILIRGMEMPEDCDKCKLCALIPVGMYGLYRKCTPLNRNAKITVRRKDCPLHELPEHGDLIDRDVLLAEYERDERAADEHGREFSFSFDSGGARCTEWGIVQQNLMDAHAIVPASKEDTE